MIKNYKIADHKCYHLTRCTVETFAAAGVKFWEGFAKPVAIVAGAIMIGLPFAWISGSTFGCIWR